MGEVRDPRLSTADQGNRSSDVAHRPQCEREVMHRQDAGVRSKAKGQIVALRMKQGESLFKMFPRFEVLSGEPMRDSGRAVSNSCLGRIGSRLDVAEEGLSVGPHRRQLAAHEVAGPQTVVGRQPFGRVLVAGC